MKKFEYIKISEFSKMTGISRANLIYYDNIGLLSPNYRGDNGYRYYSFQNLGEAYLIANLRQIGVSIEEIKAYSESRTPAKMINLFQAKSEEIEKKITHLKQMQEGMRLYNKLVSDLDITKIDDIEVVELEELPIFKQKNTFSYGKSAFQTASISFYNDATNQGIGGNYPLGTIMEIDVLGKKIATNCQFFLSVPVSLKNSDRPKGTYVVGYQRGGYGQAKKLHRRLLAYINNKGLKIVGKAYEDYPLNEISMKKEEDYLIRVMIQID